MKFTNIPFHYIWRNLLTRKLTTLLTAGGMALVVFVFAAVLMLEAGLRETLISTGQPDNVVVIRKSAQTEVQSGVQRREAAIVESEPNIAVDAQGDKLISKETVVLISQPKKSTGRKSNIVVRGTGAKGLALRPQVVLTEGRLFRPGSSEVIVGRSIRDGFHGAAIGDSLRFAQRDWTVVGVFDAGKTGFSSEVWGDSEQMLQAFRRTAYSAVVFKLYDPSSFEAMKTRLEADPRLTLELKTETRFYADQSEALATFIKILGTVLSIIFSIGAIIGAMITMYAAVANRVGEIGALRALGFQRRAIMAAFLLESLLLSLTGGVVGLLAASTMQWFQLSTTNWQTFSELAFSFSLTSGITVRVLLFSLAMGFIGGFLPAARAARMNIVDALREG
ncbi:ABC transporter permease [Parachitinimonas caeni]|uniref:ABC transporter permease n=1 Tax=Parachitinimonas caeni TaxID=3031301 RepID=A0ABT7DTV8_9NEIS|nr:ABC transporter permease [Parachitinimonas caeni]MDK2123512.1 ABC transporter permease [Parachitinimonas caeni]